MCSAAGGVLMHIDLVVNYSLGGIYGAHTKRNPDLFVTKLLEING